MKKQVIAVDIDEVLVPHNEVLADLHNRLFGTNHTVKDYHDDWPHLWSVDRGEAEKRAEIWWNSKEWKTRHSKIIDGAIEALNKLEKSHDLVVVTGRSRRTASFTENWLKGQFGSTFKEIHFVGLWEEGLGNTKADICKKIGADYLIEDSLEQAKACTKVGIKVLLFGDYNWN